MTGIVVFGAAMAAGAIQAVTGFGAGIIMMLFFPSFFPVLEAGALSAAINLTATGATSWKYRKKIEFRLTVVPSVFFIFAATAALSLVSYVSTDILLKLFGAFLVMLSIYFLTTSGNLNVRGILLTAGICSLISGVASGLFGIGGPPMVVYFLAVLQDKKRYLGTIQFFFFITGSYNFILRILKGIYTAKMIPYTLLGIVAVMIGKHIGEKIVDRINRDTMQKVIYVFLGLTGLMNLFG